MKKEMAAFMLRDAVTIGSPAILCAGRHGAEAIEEKAEVIFYFVNFTNIPWVVGIFFNIVNLVSDAITRYGQGLIQRLADV